MRRAMALLCLPAVLAAPGACTEHRVKVDPIEVKPITMNINIRVDRKLDEFFDFEKRVKPGSAATSPSENG